MSSNPGQSPSPVFTCGICKRTHNNLARLRGHVRRCHPYHPLPSEATAQQPAETLNAVNPISSHVTPHTAPPAFIESTPDAEEDESDSDGIDSEEDDFGEVATAVFDFYNAYEDTSVPLYPDEIPLDPPFEDIHEKCKQLIFFCIENHHTQSDSERHWELFMKTEQHLPVEYRYVGVTFPPCRPFLEYIRRVKMRQVQEEGWKKVVIKSADGVNETGVFRSSLDLLKACLEECGGPDALQDFALRRDNGNRQFSSVRDSNLMRDYEYELKSEGRRLFKIAGLDLYCDGTTLAKSGSQSAHTLRIRFTNLDGKGTDWHEIGIAPVLLERDDGTVRTKHQTRIVRMHLFQRFLFVALRDLISSSSIGIFLSGVLVIPRLFIVVSDRVQERVMYCLKGGESFRDCTQCEMISRVKKPASKRKAGDDAESGDRPSKRRRTAIADSDNSSFSSMESNASNESGASSVRNNNTAAQREPPNEQVDPIVVQLSGKRAALRKVCKTVRSQVFVARQKRAQEGIAPSPPSLSGSDYDLPTATAYLEKMSALPCPPALAAFHGLGSPPYKLYRTCGFDKLHAVDLGIMRLVPDLLCKRFADRSRAHIPISQVVKAANQRILDMPRCTNIPRVELFVTYEGQVQSGMTGFIRLEFAPFLWVLVMGLDRSVTGDEDDLLQESLLLSQLNADLMGINRSRDSANRTSVQIERIQKSAFECCKLLSKALDHKVTTKFHRVMYHLSDHLTDLGCLRKGATDENETLHKGTKAAYRATNQKLDTLATQLLQARTNVMRVASDPREPDQIGEEASGLYFRNPLAKKNAPAAGSSGPQSSSRPSGDRSNRRARHFFTSAFSSAQQNVRATLTPEDAEKSVLRLPMDVGNYSAWKKKKSYRLHTRLPWANETEICQMIYADDKVFGIRDRRDSVIYRWGSANCVGIVQAIFEHKKSATVCLIIRKLVQTQPALGNTKVVSVYGHKRYKYALNEHGRVHLDFIQASALVRLLVIVPDTYDIVERYGIKKAISDLPKTTEERLRQRFFVVRNYKYSSLPEQM